MAGTRVATTYEADARPMMEMNTTPLIDVMLVLLIMLIVTIPVQTHVVKIPLPQGGVPLVNALKDEIAVSRSGAIAWNGEGVSQVQLAALLQQVATLPKPPEIHLRPDAESRYETVDQVLAIAKRQQVKLLGFVGNERYANF